MRRESPGHRVVWDPSNDITTITAAVTGNDARLNGSAGRLLFSLSEGRIGVRALHALQGDFASTCVRNGWITADGLLDASVAVVPRTPHLRRLQIELGLRCNLQCAYCYSSSGPRARARLSPTDVVALLDEAAAIGVVWVDFTGGEVLLYQGWEDVLTHARNLGLVVTLHTNGTLLTERVADRLADIGLRHLQVSLDSHRAEVHDAIRGPRAFERTLAGMRIARAKGIRLRVTLMAHRRNLDHFREAAQWVIDELRVTLLLDRLIAAGGEREAKLGLSTHEFYEVIAPLLGKDVRAARLCDPPLGRGAEQHIEPDCGVAQSLVYVTANGELALCPTMTSREAPELAGPRLTDAGLRAAWYDSVYFNRLRNVNCENTGRCPTARTCGGGCRSNAYLELGRLTAPDVLSCNLNKNASNRYVDFTERYRLGVFGVATSSS